MMNRRIAFVPLPAHGPLMEFEGGAAAVHENVTMPDLSEPLGSKKEDTMANDGKHGFTCPHGCSGKDMKSAHGLARHISAKHGGFGGLGKALKTHGAGGKAAEPRAGFMDRRTADAHESRISSYAGDGGGSYGKSKQA